MECSKGRYGRGAEEQSRGGEVAERRGAARRGAGREWKETSAATLHFSSGQSFQRAIPLRLLRLELSGR